MSSIQSESMTCDRRPDFFPALGGQLLRGSLALLLGALSTVATAAPITGDDAKVVICTMASGQGQLMFNPLAEYGSPIRYARFEKFMYVKLGGDAYELDLDNALEEAMSEWTAAVPSLRFQPLPAGLENLKTWRTTLNTVDDLGFGAGFASGTRVTAGPPRLVIYQKAFEIAAGEFYKNMQYMESDLISDYLAFLLRLVAKHEVGHMLGLLHPPHAREPGDARDATGCLIQAVFEAPNIVTGPPIMARNLTEVLRLMTTYLGRRVRITDLQIAPQEAFAARAAFEQVCPVNYQARASAPRSSVSICPEISRVISQSIPVVNQLLLED